MGILVHRLDAVFLFFQQHRLTFVHWLGKPRAAPIAVGLRSVLGDETIESDMEVASNLWLFAGETDRCLPGAEPVCRTPWAQTPRLLLQWGQVFCFSSVNRV